MTQDPRKDYRFDGELGHGNYGSVQHVIQINSGSHFACKILRDDGSAVQRGHLVSEITALWNLRKHPNICTLYEVRLLLLENSPQHYQGHTWTTTTVSLFMWHR